MKRNLRTLTWAAFILAVCAASALPNSAVAVKNLQREYQTDPLGIDIPKAAAESM